MSTTNSTTASSSSPEVSSAILSSATSKLIPATAPAVSPWGNTSSSFNGTKSNWQTADNFIAKDPPLGVNTAPKEKAAPPPKVKSTGKEKWVKYDAEIIISSATGINGQNKKKNSSNGNNGSNNNGNGNNNSGKKKLNNNGNKNQNHKKDPKHKKQHNDSKNPNNNTSASEKKKSNNSTDRKAEPKTTDYGASQTIDNVAELSIDNNGSKEGVSPSTESAVIGVDKVKPEPADAVAAKTVSNGEFDSERNRESKLAYSQEKSNPLNSQQNGYKKSNFQHRNSEPYTPGGSNPTTHRRRYNSSNNKGFNPRHSIGSFNNVPIMNPGFNSYYMPMIPNMYGYNQFGNSFVPPHPPTGLGSRSNSHSPVKDDFVALNSQPPISPLPTDANVITQFIPQHMMYSPYPQDLNSLILETVSYYFSDVNLAKDIFLRRHMNSNGFVPLSILIGFNKLRSLTGGDMNLLLSALGNYPDLEVSNGKVRRAHNWRLWIISYEKRLPVGQQEDDGIFEKENKETAFPQAS